MNQKDPSDMKPTMTRSERRRAAREADGPKAGAKPALMPLGEAIRFVAAAFSSEDEAKSAICYAPLTGHPGICVLGDVFQTLNAESEYKRPVPAYRVSEVGVATHPGIGAILPMQNGSGVLAFALTDDSAYGEAH